MAQAQRGTRLERGVGEEVRYTVFDLYSGDAYEVDDELVARGISVSAISPDILSVKSAQESQAAAIMDDAGFDYEKVRREMTASEVISWFNQELDDFETLLERGAAD